MPGPVPDLIPDPTRRCHGLPVLRLAFPWKAFGGACAMCVACFAYGLIEGSEEREVVHHLDPMAKEVLIVVGYAMFSINAPEVLGARTEAALHIIEARMVGQNASAVSSQAAAVAAWLDLPPTSSANLRVMRILRTIAQGGIIPSTTAAPAEAVA